MQRTRFIAAALILTCAAGVSHAQIGLGSMANSTANIVKNFDIADKNHDGLLTKEEAEKGPVPFIRAHFDEIDKTHRGVVSKQDVQDYIRSLHKAAPAAASSSH
ncbi:EF-hand domain-containing protein [Dyella sp. ASV21]|uniref:EF-hand domain-containing protein n=1 Tax=Dyella sp. ASV21 TaxID=2795114 RepID=UPI0018EE478B|nr:EF-hand domain-containing protein [Dyella sp. ASV21]